jgi:hypothetical protein
VLRLSRIDLAAAAGQFDAAIVEYRNFRNLSLAAVPNLLRAAQRWSLFNPAIRDAHYGALQQMLQTARK